eukprot:s1241_g6.t1
MAIGAMCPDRLQTHLDPPDSTHLLFLVPANPSLGFETEHVHHVCYMVQTDAFGFQTGLSSFQITNRGWSAKTNLDTRPWAYEPLAHMTKTVKRCHITWDRVNPWQCLLLCFDPQTWPHFSHRSLLHSG